jgi:hypothetical protein
MHSILQVRGSVVTHQLGIQNLGYAALQGQINLLAFPEWPGELKRLFHHDEQKFIENVRQYNSALAFTSLGVKIPLLHFVYMGLFIILWGV